MRGAGTYYGDDHGATVGGEGNMEWLTAVAPNWNACVGDANECPFHLSPGITPIDDLPDANELTEPGGLYCLTDSFGKDITKLPAPLNYFTTWFKAQSDVGPIYDYIMNYPVTVPYEFKPPFIVVGHADDASGGEPDHRGWGQSKYDGYIDGNDLESNAAVNGNYIKVQKSVAINSATVQAPSICADFQNKSMNFVGTNLTVSLVSSSFGDATCSGDVWGTFNNLSNSPTQNGWISVYNISGDGMCSMDNTLTLGVNVIGCQDPSRYQPFDSSILTVQPIGYSGTLYFALGYNKSQQAPYNNIQGAVIKSSLSKSLSGFGDITGIINGNVEGCLNGFDSTNKTCAQ